MDRINKLIKEYEDKAVGINSQIMLINKELSSLRVKLKGCLTHEWISATQALSEDRNILRARFSAYIQFKHDLQNL